LDIISNETGFVYKLFDFIVVITTNFIKTGGNLSLMDRQKEFKKINDAYSSDYTKVLRSGKFPMQTTEKGFWGYTPPKIVFEFFEKIKLEKYKHILDLGSGDGVVVLIASLFTNATGIEFDKKLVEKSKKMCKKLKLNAEFIEGDFLKHDFSKYDLIFINPDNDFSKGLDTKLKKELKGKLIVYNIVYKPHTLKKGKTVWIDQAPFFFYT